MTGPQGSARRLLWGVFCLCDRLRGAAGDRGRMTGGVGAMAKDLTFTICECADGTETERDLGNGITGIWGTRCEDDSATEAGGLSAGSASSDRCLCALRFDGAQWDLTKAAKWMADNSWNVRELQFSGDHVVREADLFQAGSYPDKNMTVTEADIARLAATDGTIPIQVEHAGGPIQLGFVDGLTAAGKWLKGRLNFLPEAHALLDRLGVRGLSVGVAPDLSRILEVSSTGSPRVAGAQYYADRTKFALGETPTGGTTMTDAPTVEQFATMNGRLIAMQAELDAEKDARSRAEAEAKAAGELARQISCPVDHRVSAD